MIGGGGGGARGVWDDVDRPSSSAVIHTTVGRWSHDDTNNHCHHTWVMLGADEFVIWIWVWFANVVVDAHAVSFGHENNPYLEIMLSAVPKEIWDIGDQCICGNEAADMEVLPQLCWPSHHHTPTIQLRSRLLLPISIDDYDYAQRDNTTIIIPTRRQILQWGSTHRPKVIAICIGCL